MSYDEDRALIEAAMADVTVIECPKCKGGRLAAALETPCDVCGGTGTTTNSEPYPEHTKMAAIKEVTQAIGEFIELGPWNLMRRQGDEWVRVPTEYALAAYFKIDLAKISDEKQTMLERMREANDRNR